MKAALKTAEGRFVVTEVDMPIIPAEDFVLARVRVAGICGTDLRHWDKAEPELECHIVGHELAGEVVEVGSGVFDLKPGDRVVIETVMGDDVCEFCNIQRYNICEHLYDVRTKFVSRAYGEFVCGPQKKFTSFPITPKPNAAKASSMAMAMMSGSSATRSTRNRRPAGPHIVNMAVQPNCRVGVRAITEGKS